MKDYGYYMDEGWMSAYNFQDARNKGDDYLRLAFKQSMVMKQNGGLLQTFSPERDGSGHMNVDHIYYTLLPHIAGAIYYGRLSPSPWSEDGPVHFFVRFSDFFLARDWRPFPEAEDRIEVDTPSVWFWQAATWRKLGDGHAQAVVPIVNKHPRERLYDVQSRYSELPRAIDGRFAVSVRPPDEWADVSPGVWELTCEPRTKATRIESRLNNGRVEFDVDGLKLFKAIVLDFRRD
jgi:hypothetical protein